MANKVYIACSLDGFIADKNNGLEWLNAMPMNDETIDEFNKFMESIDALIMGKNTFEKVLSFDTWVYEKKVFVITNSMISIPKEYENKAEFVNGSIENILNKLNSKGYKNFYIDGGKTIQSFLEKDLIDELIITTIPVILGNGIPLFSKLDKSFEFKLTNSKIVSNTAVQSSYKRIRK